MLHWKFLNGRSSRPDVLCKIGALKDFLKFRRKHPCRSLFFNKVANFIEKETPIRAFSCGFRENFKNIFYRTPPVVAFEKLLVNVSQQKHYLLKHLYFSVMHDYNDI